jgi:hypothetical protein
MTQKQLHLAIETAAAMAAGQLRETLHALFNNTAEAMKSFPIANATRASVPVTIRAYVVCIPTEQAAGFEAMLNAAVTAAAATRPTPEAEQIT